MKIAWERVSDGDENLIIPSRDLFASLVSLRACSNSVFSKYLAKCDSEKYRNASDHSLCMLGSLYKVFYVVQRLVYSGHVMFQFQFRVYPLTHL